MPRHLRPRKTRQSYTSLFQSEDEQENLSGPSRQLPGGQQEDDSGSDFAPPAPEEVANTDEHGGDDGLEDPASLGDGMGAEVDSSSESSSSMRRSKKKSSASQGKAKSTGTVTAKAKTKQKTKAIRRSKSPAPAATPNPATHQSTAPAATPAPATSARHGHALPNPNVHHRHRPVPLFSGPTAAPTSTSTPTAMLRVERLQRAPLLFCTERDHADERIRIFRAAHAQSWKGLGRGCWRGPGMADCRGSRVVQGSREVEAWRSARAAGQRGGCCDGTGIGAGAGL